MPTGRITIPGGVSGHSIQVPFLPRQIPGIKTGSGVQANGGVNAKVAQPPVYQPYGTLGSAQFYGGFVPEIAKANFIAPTNQGHRAAIDSRESMMYNPRNSPSRSQFSEGYTEAIQVFAASNTWQLAGPQDVNNGVRPKQPNQKFVSPFSSLPIPVRMPWDL
jgi:hypothetical protein